MTRLSVRESLRAHARTLVTRALPALLIAGSGGLLFQAVHAPLPWTLGSLSASALVAVSGRKWLMPAALRDVARPVVGVLAGSSFTPAVIGSALAWWPAIAYVAAFSVLISITGYILLQKIWKLDPVTAFFASTPGGLSELTLIGGSLGGEMRSLVLIHAIRIIMVVFTVPLLLRFVTGNPLAAVALPGVTGHALDATDALVLTGCAVAGWLLGRFGRFPGGVLVAAMVVSAAVHAAGLSEVAPPAWVVALMQVIIGAVAGARFAGITRRELTGTLLVALSWGAVLLIAAAIAAEIGTWLFGRPFVGMLLALAPGGMAEMIIVTYAVGIEVAFVATCQVFRSFFVLTFAPMLFRVVGPKPGEPKPPEQP